MYMYAHFHGSVGDVEQRHRQDHLFQFRYYTLQSVLLLYLFMGYVKLFIKTYDVHAAYAVLCCVRCGLLRRKMRCEAKITMIYIESDVDDDKGPLFIELFFFLIGWTTENRLERVRYAPEMGRWWLLGVSRKVHTICLVRIGQGTSVIQCTPDSQHDATFKLNSVRHEGMTRCVCIQRAQQN